MLEGWVPVELADRGPRVLQPSDRASDRSNRGLPPTPDVPPPAVIESAEAWAERDSLFGDLDR
jgi:hypothetical protein